ncbi:MAG: radical SAM protein [Lachnospiraceae bacterium]|nr:radical SAM protein [Lachnospiraceae bacterium]
MSKLIRYNNYIRQTGAAGTKPRTLFINPSNRCNFRCKQCYVSAPTADPQTVISLERIRALADEADELGIYEIVVEGGEPLVYKDLFEVLAAFGPDRFYLALTSNGYLLDEDMAKRLASAGLSRVVISLDSLTPEVHDGFRGQEGAFERALAALENVKRAGMQPSVNFLVGHYNAQTGEVEKVCNFCAARKYQVGLVPAAPVGDWKGNLDVMLDEGDTKRLEEIRASYNNAWRDLWPPIARGNEGLCSCPAVNRPYITPRGDVLPCPYIHVKIGNIYEQALKEILAYGFSIKYFCQNSAKCLTGEDREFVTTYLQKEGMSVMNPISADELFASEDFV